MYCNIFGNRLNKIVNYQNCKLQFVTPLTYHPLLSCTFILHGILIRNCTMSIWPANEALCNAVMPSPFDDDGLSTYI